jgi:dipeptidyl aminopeptidase/acylaminoacyl peptidase
MKRAIDIGEEVYLRVLTEVHHWTPPQLFSYNSVCGSTMYGMMYLPDDMDVTKKYPVVLFVYGGPHVQLVTNSYKALRYVDVDLRRLWSF